jgi:hypothetical protein
MKNRRVHVQKKYPSANQEKFPTISPSCRKNPSLWQSQEKLGEKWWRILPAKYRFLIPQGYFNMP